MLALEKSGVKILAEIKCGRGACSFESGDVNSGFIKSEAFMTR
jgi:hypothetical protein